MEDQQPCSTAEPSTFVSTTTLSKTEFSSTEITTTDITMTEALSTVVSTTEFPTTKFTTGKTTESTTEATTIADIETCDELDAEWTCSSGTRSVIDLESGVSAHLFIHHALILVKPIKSNHIVYCFAATEQQNIEDACASSPFVPGQQKDIRVRRKAKVIFYLKTLI